MVLRGGTAYGWNRGRASQMPRILALLVPGVPVIATMILVRRNEASRTAEVSPACYSRKGAGRKTSSFVNWHLSALLKTVHSLTLTQHNFHMHFPILTFKMYLPKLEVCNNFKKLFIQENVID